MDTTSEPAPASDMASAPTCSPEMSCECMRGGKKVRVYFWQVFLFLFVVSVTYDLIDTPDRNIETRRSKNLEISESVNEL